MHFVRVFFFTFPLYHSPRLLLVILASMPAPEFSCLRTTEWSVDLKVQYLELFQAVFGTPKSEGLFQRQFLPGPEQVGYHGLMQVEGILKAAYSAIPLSFIFENNTIQAALVVDALVHPDFQGKSERGKKGIAH